MGEHVKKPLSKWTEAAIISLIRHFKSNPCLWDRKNEGYFKPDLKREVWNTIGKELNLPGTECKHKMSIVLSSFRREKIKIRRRLTVHGPPYRSTWFAFKELTFLLTRRTPRRPTINLEDISTDFETPVEPDSRSEEEFSNCSVKSEPLSDDDEALERDCDIVTTMIKSTINDTTHNTECDVNPLGDPIPSWSQQNARQVQSEEDKRESYRLEEISTFVAFVQAKLKKYSFGTFNVVQKEICDILFRADERHNENLCGDNGQSGSRKRKLTDDQFSGVH